MNKGRAGPPSQHANPVAQMKTCPDEELPRRRVAQTKSCPDEDHRARVGAGPPSRHTSPFPNKAEYVQSKGGSRTTIPTHQPYALTKLQKKGGSRTTIPTHHPAKLRA